MKKYIGLLLLLFVTLDAHAKGGGGGMLGIELRGNYGLWGSTSSLNNEITTSYGSTAPTLSTPYAYGGDLIFELPMVPIILGARYESMSVTSGSGTITGTPVTTKLTASRVSGILGVRKHLMNSYFGFIGTVGVSQKADYTLTTSGIDEDYSGSLATSFSGGLEGGLQFGMFEIGIEAGYLSFKANSLTYQGSTLQTSTGANATADLSGLYAVAHLGFVF